MGTTSKMWDFFTDSHNIPFVISLCVMLSIALLEALSMMLGHGLSGVIDSITPDLDVDINTPDISGGEWSLAGLLSWLRIGQVPLLILIVVFLTGFGLSGLIIQAIIIQTSGSPLPAAIAAIPAFAASLPMVRWLGGGLNKIMPKDETQVVSVENFIGCMATITLGTAIKGKPAQAKVKDTHGMYHYIMVEPEEDGVSFSRNNKILLVKREKSVFYAIDPQHKQLTE